MGWDVDPLLEVWLPAGGRFGSATPVEIGTVEVIVAVGLVVVEFRSKIVLLDVAPGENCTIR